MNANQARFRVATMARVLGVSPSGYYAWRRRPPSARARADAELTTRVREIHARSRGTYGAPRIHVVALRKLKVSGRESTGLIDAVGGVVIWLRYPGAGAGGFAPAD